MRIVIALGGNALLHRGERPDADIQQANIDRVTTAIAALAHDHEVVLTHGNGPQIGLLAVESAADPALSAPYPLDLLGAQTQGMIGSLLVRTLHDTLPGRRIAALITHTLVRADDPAFRSPTKFVGQVLPPDSAPSLSRKHGWSIARDTTGWRRVVASPTPERIVETDTIHDLLSCGTLVICAGGGGIPVTADHDTGALSGVEAVVDKDLTAAMLAEDLKADFLLVLTDVRTSTPTTAPRSSGPYWTPRPQTCAEPAIPPARWAPRPKRPPGSSNAPGAWPRSAPSTRRTRSCTAGRARSSGRIRPPHEGARGHRPAETASDSCDVWAVRSSAGT
jgi:carbamate kinase